MEKFSDVGRTFKSRFAKANLCPVSAKAQAPLAHTVEHSAVNRKVAGSIPAWGA